MRSRIDLAVAAALVASAAVNVYLLVRSPARSPAKPPIRRAAISAARPISLLPEDISTSLSCDAQLVEVERRLETARADLGQRATLKERFDQGTIDPSLERQVKVALDRIFAAAPADFRYDLDCRDSVCRVTTHVGATDYDWVEDIHHIPWSSMMFHGTAAYVELPKAP